MFEILLSAFFIGLLGAGHCLGMCGGIASALTFALPAQHKDKNIIAKTHEPDTLHKHKKGQGIAILLAYNFGRIASYTLIGAVFAYLSQSLSIYTGLTFFRVVAGVLLILMAFYLLSWWRVLTRLEWLGAKLWRVLQPHAAKLMPVKSIGHGFALGALWGWLPCGLVYTALAYATAQSNVLYGAAVMFFFGLGTMPAVFSGGLMAVAVKNVLQKAWFKFTTAAALFCFGVWTLLAVVIHSGHAHHDGAHSNGAKHHSIPASSSHEQKTDKQSHMHHH